MSIARNAGYNLVGLMIPTLLALATVPAYLKLIGPERYGVLAIAWLILGYFGVFDLGLGKATAQRIAALRDAAPEERAVAFGTALASNMVVGLVGAAIMWPAAWYLFQHEMNVPANLRDETMHALPFLAMAVPVATTLGVFSGAIMAREKFLVANRISVTSTTLFQLFPLAVTWIFGANMSLLLAASIAARIVGLFMYGRECRKEFGADAWRRFDRGQLRSLLSYGGWITVTALFTPILVIVDRFMIGAMISAYAVTVYVVPMQLTSRITTLAQSLGNAMFPRLAVAEGAEAQAMSRDGIGSLFALLTPAVVGAYVLMENGLNLWVGHHLGADAAPVGRILLLAAWTNVLGLVPWTRLQAIGKPDLIAKIYMVETPLFLPALYFGILHGGVVGAAWVYFLRLVIDLVILDFVAAGRIDHFWPIVATMAGFAVLELVLGHVPLDLAVRIPLAVGAALVALVPSWIAAPAALRRMVLGLPGKLNRRHAST